MSRMSKIKMYPVNLVIMKIQIQTKEGMNEYKQYRKRFFMESANRVGGALTGLMQSKGECKKLSELGPACRELIIKAGRFMGFVDE